MDKKAAREHGYFIIPTDDGDRYLWEVVCGDDNLFIATSSEEANDKLEEEWNRYVEKNHLDLNEEENDN